MCLTVPILVAHGIFRGTMGPLNLYDLMFMFLRYSLVHLSSVIFEYWILRSKTQEYSMSFWIARTPEYIILSRRTQRQTIIMPRITKQSRGELCKIPKYVQPLSDPGNMPVSIRKTVGKHQTERVNF